MPSWNIHIAHAERLLEGGGSVARVVRDRNAFLFGNLIPDIYVGYMVPGVVRAVPYRVTHFAKPEHIPKPRASEFFDAYVLPLAHECGLLDARGDGCVTREGVEAACAPGGPARSLAAGPAASLAAGPAASAAAEGPEPERSWRAPASLSVEVAHVSPAHAPTFAWDCDVADTAKVQRAAYDAECGRLPEPDLRRSLFDMVLGAWVHLLADCTWNQAVSDLLGARGEQPSRDFRIKKQGDFDLFGKSLELDLMPHLTPQLIEVAAAFPQYEIDAASVSATCAIAHETVRTNHPVTGAAYRLLDEDFFNRVFAEVNARVEREMECAGVDEGSANQLLPVRKDLTPQVALGGFHAR